MPDLGINRERNVTRNEYVPNIKVNGRDSVEYKIKKTRNKYLIIED